MPLVTLPLRRGLRPSLDGSRVVYRGHFFPSRPPLSRKLRLSPEYVSSRRIAPYRARADRFSLSRFPLTRRTGELPVAPWRSTA